MSTVILCYSMDVVAIFSPSSTQSEVRVPDLVQALLGSEDFAMEVAKKSPINWGWQNQEGHFITECRFS